MTRYGSTDRSVADLQCRSKRPIHRSSGIGDIRITLETGLMSCLTGALQLRPAPILAPDFTFRPTTAKPTPRAVDSGLRSNCGRGRRHKSTHRHKRTIWFLLGPSVMRWVLLRVRIASHPTPAGRMSRHWMCGPTARRHHPQPFCRRYGR